ncbi:glycosyl hydrolase family 18 protein [Cellulosimicrobium marinum]|uniref:glycosyl hydrolase family 18 protein n=1 Tax=Cellulosimicrobium marinum TaxID=1638992 RepID=UPI001E35F5CA|nr:glycosyl hydrolase family 18 protein [Cellulosimicrobium marinum]MCB7136304.1 chitinase C-terminal domain-containing protein [Cellulosimicrobium marinum]
MVQTPGVNTPYCDVYDENGREKLPNGLDRRVIGYFTSWRTGVNEQPRYLASDIPWNKISHINYAFAHVDGQNKVSVNASAPGNSATDMTWPGVAGAEMDPTLDYTGHFNLLAKYKKENPGVKVLPAVGGWAETGGYFDASGKRVASGGFYTMTESQAKIDTFADSVVAFIREYGFDGIDIDYEYPTSNNQAGNPDDFHISDKRRGQLFKGYIDLMKTLREKLDVAGAQDGEYYMLTTATPSSGWLLRGMEVYQVTQYTDYVNMMTYDLHGAWNEYVGGNGALFDDGKDPELAAGGVYTAYKGIGYLNGDWSSHYFRGAMQGGRINLGVPFYTRGFQNVQGGTNGMGGRAPAPAGFACPAGTNNKCGYGAEGVDNLWYDTDPQGNAVPAGVNPIWHVLNLQKGITGDYATSYKVPTSFTGTYTHHFDPVTKNEWWWNAQRKVFLSGDSDQAVAAKADYVNDTGLGGLMIWELAGDYDYNQAKGQYEIGSSLVDLMHTKFSSSTPYGATKANADRPMPTKALDVDIRYTEFALGDNNYPISPKVVFTNNGATDIPAGALISFQYGTTDTGEMSDWSGFKTTVTAKGHTGDNVGGLDGDFHTVQFTVPTGGIPAGGSITNQLKWALPAAQFSNVIVTVDGVAYSTTYDHLRGATVVDLPGSGTGNGNGNGNGNGQCTAPAWAAGTVYTGGTVVSHAGKVWTARYWTQNDTPGASAWGPWADGGVC